MTGVWLRRLGLPLIALFAVTCTNAQVDEDDAATTGEQDGELLGGVILVNNRYGVPLHIVGLDIEGATGRHVAGDDPHGNYDEGVVPNNDRIDVRLFYAPEPDHCLQYAIVAYDPVGTEVARLDPGLCTGVDNYSWAIEDPTPDAGHILVENHTGAPVEVLEEKQWPPGNYEPPAPESPYVDRWANVDYGEAPSGGVSLRIPVGDDPDHCLEHPLIARSTVGGEDIQLDAGTCTGPDDNYTWLIGESPTTTTIE